MKYADLSNIKVIFFIINSLNHWAARKVVKDSKNNPIPIQFNLVNSMRDVSFYCNTSIPVIGVSKSDVLLIMHRDFFGLEPAFVKIKSLVESGFNVMYVTDKAYEAEEIKSEKNPLSSMVCGVAYDSDLFKDSKEFARGVGYCFMPK